MARVILAFCLFIGANLYADQSSVVGRFSVIGAKCDDLNFVWKKHDTIMDTGSILVFGGEIETVEFDKICRFQDIYQKTIQSQSSVNGKVHEVSTLIPTMRRHVCWQAKDGIKIGEPSVEEKEIDSVYKSVEMIKKGRSATIMINDSEFCDSLIELELTH